MRDRYDCMEHDANNIYPALFFIMMICGLSVVEMIKKIHDFDRVQMITEYARRKYLILSNLANSTFHHLNQERNITL